LASWREKKKRDNLIDFQKCGDYFPLFAVTEKGHSKFYLFFLTADR